MNNNKTASILGCGWLGLPLAQALIKRGYAVKGSTTHEKKLSTLQAQQIKPYLIQFSPQINANHSPDFFNNEILIVNVPPGRRRENVEAYHTEQINSLLEVLKKATVQKLVFISSTSVYPDVNRVVTETEAGMPESDSGKALLKAEEMLLAAKNIKTTVIRFCGLFGYDRNPGRFFAGKTLDESGKAPVNFIHQDDCIQIISTILEKDKWNTVYNACADCHPDKKIFYTKAAEKSGLPIPEYLGNKPENYKEISSEKLKKELNYQFIFPDPMQVLR